MGEVFLAEHRHIDRQAAIKVLLPELSANEEMVARFFTEARSASLIQHPGIVEIVDCEHRSARPRFHRHGVAGRGKPCACLAARREARLRLGARGSSGRSRARSLPRTRRGSSTATSSRTTSSSCRRQTPRRRCRSRFSTSASPSWSRRRARGEGPHADRKPARHAALHVARAVPRGRQGRSPDRHLFARLHPLRDAAPDGRRSSRRGRAN